jgi:hypothetical protein
MTGVCWDQTMLRFISKNIPWIFLASLSLAGIGLVFLATAKYGAGLAGDSMNYISVAERLLAGDGFVDFAEVPLVFFPPLFPGLIAALSWVSRADVFVVGWVLDALLWGVNIFLSGLFLKRIFRAQSIYFYLSTLIIFLSPSALAMHASVLTDPLFLTFTLLFFLLGESYIEKPAWQPFVALFVIAALSPLLRYSGLAQIVTGGLIILYAHGRVPTPGGGGPRVRGELVQKLLKSISLAAFFCIFSLLPMSLWIYFHNYRISGTWWGGSTTAGADLLVNILQSLRKIMYWFIPYRPISKDGFVEPVIILVLILVILIALNKKQHWLAWVKEFLRSALVSMLLLTLVYFSSLMLNMQTGDHKSLFSDRYLVIIMLPVLTLMFITFDRLIAPHIPLRTDVIQVGLVVFFLLWSVYPGYKIYKYISVSLVEGESGYNQYNTRAFHESEILAKVKTLLQKEPDARLYSNIPAAVWFNTRHLLVLPPAQDLRRTKDEIKIEFAGWPHDKPGYYVWFEPDPFELFMPLNDLSLVADLEVVAQAADGMIVRVSARGGQ